MNDSILILKNFIRNPKETGAVAPSSRFLTKEIINNIDFKAAKCIVELGPGSGVFTKAILKKARTDARIFCFEVNKKFCSYLEKKLMDKRIKIINAPAEGLAINLKKLGIINVDCVVSGLPFKNFSNSKKSDILKQVSSSLSERGRFVLFQYTKGLGDMLESCFDRIERKFVPINIPPAFVYVCEK